MTHQSLKMGTLLSVPENNSVSLNNSSQNELKTSLVTTEAESDTFVFTFTFTYIVRSFNDLTRRATP